MTSWLPYFELFVDLAKGLAWPVAISIALLIFRKDIRALIPRISKVSATGFELANTEQLENTPNMLDKNTAISETPLETLVNPIAAELEEKNRKDLEALGPKNPTERESILLRALTIQQMMKSFGIAYSGVFGSQIRALRELNSRNISHLEAEAMFAELKKENPALEKFSLQMYMNYLLHWKFVSLTEGYYSITETGRDFLRFIVDNGLTEDRVN